MNFSANFLAFFILTAALAYFLLVKKDDLRLGVFCASVLISLIAAELLKHGFGYHRPFMTLDEISPLFFVGGADSFPSGHATVFAAVATALFIEHRRLGLAATLLALIMGASRIAAGVHYMEDILAGFLLGVLLTLSLYQAAGILRNKKSKRED